MDPVLIPFSWWQSAVVCGDILGWLESRAMFSAPSTLPLPDDRVSSRLAGRLLIAFSVLLTLAYLPALQGKFIWDDDDYIINNPNLCTVEGLVRTWTDPHSLPQWYPLVHSTFWVEYQIWKLWPVGYHVDNLLLHLANVYLLYRILLRLNFDAISSVMAAMVFGAMPVHVESVAWATERKNVLSGFFYLSAALAYFRFEPPDATPPHRRSWKCWIAAFALFIAAMFSKTVTATFPAAMLVVFWWKRGRLKLSDTIPLLPFFIVGIGLGIFTATTEVEHVGAKGAEFSLTVAQRLLIAGRAPWFYLSKLVAPYPLAFIYSRWTLDPRSLSQWLFPAALLMFLGILLLLRGRIGRGPAAAKLIFCGTLTPVLGFVNVYPFRYSFVADHFQYLASIGPIALLVAALFSILPRFFSHKTVIYFCIAWILILAVLDWRQCENYADLKTLWTNTAAASDAWIAHDELGAILLAEGKVDEAIPQFRRAAAIQPIAPEPHYNIGKAMQLLGRPDLAEAEYRQSVSLDPLASRPMLALGDLRMEQNRRAEAIDWYQKALAARPDIKTRVYCDEGLIDAGQVDQGLGDLKALLRKAPSNVEANGAVGMTLLNLRRPQEAEPFLSYAAQHEPGRADLWYGDGIALEAIGQFAAAEEAFRRSLAIDPHNKPAIDALRSLLAKQRQ